MPRVRRTPTGDTDMNIRKLQLSHFTSHELTILNFPDRGVVLVTGPNGAGKSSIAEAVAVANFGKTLRGTDPWQTGVAGHVICVSDMGTATRKITAKGTKSTNFVVDPDAPGRVFDTSTKAKDAAEKVLGDFDMWRRTHVFSSADAAHFTLSSDGQRKELLEELLHLSCFDEAAQKCKLDLRNAAETLGQHRARLVAAQQVQATTQAAIDALTTAPAEPAPTPPTSPFDPVELTSREEEVARLSVALREAQQRSNAAIARMRPADLTRAANMAEADVKGAAAHARATSAGSCSACGQPIDEAHRAEAEEKLAVCKEVYRLADEALRSAAKMAQLDFDHWQTQLAAVQEQQREAQGQLQQVRDRKAAWDRHATATGHWAARQAQRQGHRDDLETRWQLADDAIYAVQVDFDAATMEHDELSVCADVLGLRGVRAHVLGQALGGIEAVANIYLSRIAQKGLHLVLKSYSETATGNVQDKISLEVIGAGGGHGYKASSGGERRRIDAALLLALAEVASAASGRPPGTLFLDEIADSLDDAGCAAVCEAIGEMAQDRCVVVISHNDVLARSLHPAKHIHVDSGVVSDAA